MARLAYPAFLLGSATLSLGPLMVRVSEVGPLPSAFWRLAIGAGPLLLCAWLIPSQKARRPFGKGPLFAAGFAAVFFAADLMSWHLGIVRTSLANASLFGNMACFLLVAYGLMTGREHISRKIILPLTLAGSGAALLFGVSAQLSLQHLAGDLLCFLAAVFYTGYLAAIGSLRARQPAITVLALVTTIGALIMLPVAWLAPGPLFPHSLSGWLPLLVLGLGSQVLGQGLIVYGLAHLSTTASGLGLLVQPIIGALLGWVLFAEKMGPIELLGASLILAALISQALPKQPRSQQA